MSKDAAAAMADRLEIAEQTSADRRKSPLSLVMRAEALRREGQLSEAVDTFHAAAQMLLDQNKLLQAINLFRNILTVNPRHLPTLHSLSKMVADSGRWRSRYQVASQPANPVETREAHDAIDEGIELILAEELKQSSTPPHVRLRLVKDPPASADVHEGHPIISFRVPKGQKPTT